MSSINVSTLYKKVACIGLLSILQYYQCKDLNSRNDGTLRGRQFLVLYMLAFGDGERAVEESQRIVLQGQLTRTSCRVHVCAGCSSLQGRSTPDSNRRGQGGFELRSTRTAREGSRSTECHSTHHTRLRIRVSPGLPMYSSGGSKKQVQGLDGRDRESSIQENITQQ